MLQYSQQREILKTKEKIKTELNEMKKIKTKICNNLP